MITVIVTQHNIFHRRQVHSELAGVIENRSRPRTGVKEDPMPIRFDQCCETPLADPRVGEHRGEYLDPEIADAAWRCRLAGLGKQFVP